MIEFLQDFIIPIILLVVFVLPFILGSLLENSPPYDGQGVCRDSSPMTKRMSFYHTMWMNQDE